MTDPFKPSPALLVKLGSLVVHYQELNSMKGHAFDRSAIHTLESDSELKEWLREMNKLAMLPVKR